MTITVSRSIQAANGFVINEAATATVAEEPVGDDLYEFHALTRALFNALPQMQRPKENQPIHHEHQSNN
jgi:hypothetical protein